MAERQEVKSKYILFILSPVSIRTDIASYGCGDVLAVEKLTEWQDAPRDIHLMNGDVLKEFTEERGVRHQIAILMERTTYALVKHAMRVSFGERPFEKG